MNAGAMPALRGVPLPPSDLEQLARTGISPKTAEQALLRRVDSFTGAEIVGRNSSGDYGGIVFPYVWPGEDHVREYRLRRDHSEMEPTSDGTFKERNKYLSPSGRSSLLYICPSACPTWLSDPKLQIIVTEGEKKTLALQQLAEHALGDSAERPRWLAVGLAGVWNWRGTIGKTIGPNGDRRDVKGPIPDLDRITWQERQISILFDANVHTNESVAVARKMLAVELRKRGARVKFVDVPADAGVNGVDDLVGLWGSDRVLELITTSPHTPDEKRSDTNVDELTLAITEADRFAKDAGGRMYIFQRGAYKANGEAFIRTQVKALHKTWGLAHSWSTKKANEVVEYIRVDCPELWPEVPADTINVQNGLLDVRTRTLRPHTPEFYSSVQLPLRFDPLSICPAWEQFIADVFPADSAEMGWEILAWLMTSENSIQKAILLLGDGANGKSTYLRGCVSFIGKQNATALSLHKIEQDRFAAARLIGKLANICPDLPTAHLSSTSMFKALTGGDVVLGEYKFKDSFEYVPFCKLVFSANKPPETDDATHGFFRRWQVVPFTKSFEEDAEGTVRRDVLDARLSNPTELSGLLNKALIALARIRRQGFTQSASMQQAWDEFRRVTDPLSVWLDQHTIQLPTAMVGKAELMSAFNKSLLDAKKPPLSKTAFGLALRRVRKDIDEAQRTFKGRLQWVYLGIALGTAPPEDEERLFT